MQTIKLNTDQTLLDAALQHLGDASQTVGIALQNNASLTDDVVSVDVGMADISMQQEVEVLNKVFNIPTSTDNVPIGKGVGYWRVGIDFKVS